ncbi:DUF4097 family beta strand repeat-containing protein [Sporosarcina sp. FA9]|uniref:DUF4097 family beta strand repeat-containing protein n=1 Tax=Sporosarcina sp. FA9 TaxID=3413030 RepID=UPI003F65CC28
MNENQFIIELENALKRLTEDERNDITQDIREYFIEGRKDGKTDVELTNSLGSAQSIADDLLTSYSFIEEKALELQTSELITIQDSYENIDMVVQQGSLVIKPSDSQTTIVELENTNDKLKLTAEVIDGVLFIRLKSLRHWLFSFNFNMKAVVLNVYIPKKIYQSIVAKTDNGRISAEKLLAKKIGMESDNGRIQLSEIATTTLIAQTDNGRIEITKVQADTVKVKTDNGRIEMQSVDCESMTVESDNGRIELDNIDGDLVGYTNNGRISLTTSHLNRNIDCKTDNGSISILSDSQPTNVTIHAKTNHGKVDVFGESNSKTVIGSGENTIRLKSDNGRITVN